MKTIALILLLAAAGCAQFQAPEKVVAKKSTVFGFEAADPTSSVAVRFGLIRSFLYYAPVATNRLYTAEFYSDVDADLHLNRQQARERIGAGVTNFQFLPVNDGRLLP